MEPICKPISDRLWEMDDLVRLVEAYENSTQVKL
jgi:hypothetical protein